MADFNTNDWDDVFKKYGGTKYDQGFNEIDYNQNDQFRELKRYRDELKRQEEEQQRRLEEQREAMRRTEREHIERRPRFDHDYLQDLLGTLKNSKQKTEKELMIEKLTVKFCFLQHRLMSMQTNFVLGSPNAATEKLRLIALKVPVPVLLDKMLKSLIKEAERNGISKEEVSSSIKKMLSETSESAICGIFINHFFGATALKIFKDNPNIIKDKNQNDKEDARKKAKEAEEIAFEAWGDLDGFQRVQRILDEMEDRRGDMQRGRYGEYINFGDGGMQTWVTRQGMPIIDYPNQIIERRTPQSLLDQIRDLYIKI